MPAHNRRTTLIKPAHKHVPVLHPNSHQKESERRAKKKRKKETLNPRPAKKLNEAYAYKAFGNHLPFSATSAKWCLEGVLCRMAASGVKEI